MNVVPRSKRGMIDFYLRHVEPWSAHAAQIGTSPGAVSELADRATVAREAYDAQRAARQAAMAATIKLDTALDALATAGTSIIKQIRAQAGLAGDTIYALASIPAPDAPSPAGAPGTPSRFTVALDQVGVLTLKWTCENPRGTSGTMYQVWRQIGSTGPFVYVGGTGEKKFVDETLPAGTASVTYRVQAVRSTRVGMVATHNVNFGTSAGSACTVPVAPGRFAKFAA